MKARELRELSNEELTHKLEELKKQILELNYQRLTQTIKKPHMLRMIKKDIARILTIINERKRSQNA